MGLNILFWNCQGIRPKRKELELYLKENEIDIVALNETFLNKKLNFRITGYDIIRNDRSTGHKGGVALLVKHGLIINKEYRNSDFSIITSNEALAINLDISNNQNLTLATIYCPNGNPNFSLLQSINNLSDNVMFVGDFNSKLESFGYSKKPLWSYAQKQLNLIYLNNDEHTRIWTANGSTDILYMAFISPNLAKHDIQFQIGDELGSYHLPIEISIDTPPHRNTFTNHTKYRFDRTDREVFESTLEEALGSSDFSGHLSTSDIDKYADFIVTAERNDYGLELKSPLNFQVVLSDHKIKLHLFFLKRRSDVIFIDETRDLDSDLQVYGEEARTVHARNLRKHVGINGVINIFRVNMKYKV